MQILISRIRVGSRNSDNGSNGCSKSSSRRHYLWFSSEAIAGNLFETFFFLHSAMFFWGLSDMQIWDEVGESDEERDKMLLQLEQECLDVYKRKVDQAAKSRAQLLQTLADANVELSSLVSALGERSFVGIVSSYPIVINAYWFLTPEKSSGTIKEQLAAVAPTLEQLWKQKEDRINDFFDVQSQIQKIRGEIVGTSGQVGSPAVDEADLSLKKLDEFKSQLQELQKEKASTFLKYIS
ncbi:hypothetical protein RHMOL_Rhmol06G0305800 [Rhododendron molle]|uniref:Uncharacterized protein n=1 Tax=Rhododendron molle TaxID=49168 RepID=A0ACC0NI29_RHOML|nr:hypothetical protein RHMOL_Rhmol06G0305800 [Rhododendron molle]